MSDLQEMSGDTLHWRVLHKYIKQQCKKIKGIVLNRSVVKHFVSTDGKNSKQIREEEAKVKKAVDGLIRTGYITTCLGTTEVGFGVCLVLEKDVTTSKQSDEDE